MYSSRVSSIIIIINDKITTIIIVFLNHKNCNELQWSCSCVGIDNMEIGFLYECNYSFKEYIIYLDINIT